jgi:hypothetical protein
MAGKVTVSQIGSPSRLEKSMAMRAGCCWEAAGACRFGERRPQHACAHTAPTDPQP